MRVPPEQHAGRSVKGSDMTTSPGVVGNAKAALLPHPPRRRDRLPAAAGHDDEPDRERHRHCGTAAGEHLPACEVRLRTERLFDPAPGSGGHECHEQQERDFPQCSQLDNRELLRHQQHRPVQQIQRIRDEADADQYFCIKHPADDGRVGRAGVENQRSSAGGENGRQPRERRTRVEEENGRRDRAQPQHRESVPGADRERWRPGADDQPAEQQLPSSGRRPVEGGVGMPRDQVDAERQRRPRDHGKTAHHPGCEVPRDDEQDQRIEDVELLLDAERPRVQERLAAGGRVEVAGLLPEQHVRDEQGHRQRALAEVLKAVERKENNPCREDERQSGEQRGEDPADPPLVERRHRKGALLDLSEDDAGDQVSGDDEEDVHPDVAAGEPTHAQVVEHYRENGNPAKSVDVGPVSERHHETPFGRTPHTAGVMRAGEYIRNTSGGVEYLQTLRMAPIRPRRRPRLCRGTWSTRSAAPGRVPPP